MDKLFKQQQFFFLHDSIFNTIKTGHSCGASTSEKLRILRSSLIGILVVLELK